MRKDQQNINEAIELFKTFGPNYTVGIKYGMYEGDDLPYTDTDKFWLWGEINF